MKDKTTAGVLALVLGGIGAHKFYLGRTGQGLLYLIFFWTFIPALVAFIEAITYFTMNEASFNLKYNGGMGLTFAAPSPSPIVVNVANSATTGGADVATQIKALHDLRVAGALTDGEFERQKSKLLSTG